MYKKDPSLDATSSILPSAIFARDSTHNVTDYQPRIARRDHAILRR